MPHYKVTFENGQCLYVNAPDEAGARAHVDDDLVRNPRVGRPVGAPSEFTRPAIDQRTPIKSVEIADKWTVRRQAQLEGQVAVAQAELTGFKS